MIVPTLHEAKEYIANYDVVPVAYELLFDTHTPINLFLAFKDTAKICFLLESAENAEQWGRYSFIGFDPKQEITIKGNEITVTYKNGTVEKTVSDNPLSAIETLMNGCRSPRIKNMPHLTGGLIGYFGYDTVRYIEKKLKHPRKDDLMLPECHLLLCDEIIAFDHSRHTISVIVNVPTHGDFAQNYLAGVERAKTIALTIKNAVPSTKALAPQGELSVRSNITRELFEENVLKAKEHIANGDIFQVVLSQRFEVENAPDSFDVYRTLRAINPSPYMYYFKFDDYFIAGASPEMLLNVDNGIVSTRPIAGTIRRGRDEEEDRVFENALICDPKERAEHAMLVDLGRNDVGKVSKFGSVEVTRLMDVERYSAVMHIVSDVKGELRDDKTGMDALMAVLPAGTLSGAPKVRAMELIDEIETTKRCLYGGTVGYLSFDSRIDTCIAIRTILFKNGRAYIQVGAGIVADSVPEKEFEETQSKAKAMINAIMKARELL